MEASIEEDPRPRLRVTYVVNPEKGMSDLTFIEDPQNLLVRLDKLSDMSEEYLYEAISKNVKEPITFDVAHVIKIGPEIIIDIDVVQTMYVLYDMIWE